MNKKSHIWLSLMALALTACKDSNSNWINPNPTPKAFNLVSLAGVAPTPTDGITYELKWDDPKYVGSTNFTICLEDALKTDGCDSLGKVEDKLSYTFKSSRILLPGETLFVIADADGAQSKSNTLDVSTDHIDALQKHTQIGSPDWVKLDGLLQGAPLMSIGEPTLDTGSEPKFKFANKDGSPLVDIVLADLIPDELEVGLNLQDVLTNSRNDLVVGDDGKIFFSLKKESTSGFLGIASAKITDSGYEVGAFIPKSEISASDFDYVVLEDATSNSMWGYVAKAMSSDPGKRVGIVFSDDLTSFKVHKDVLVERSNRDLHSTRIAVKDDMIVETDITSPTELQLTVMYDIAGDGSFEKNVFKIPFDTQQHAAFETLGYKVEFSKDGTKLAVFPMLFMESGHPDLDLSSLERLKGFGLFNVDTLKDPAASPKTFSVKMNSDVAKAYTGETVDYGTLIEGYLSPEGDTLNVISNIVVDKSGSSETKTTLSQVAKAHYIQ
nr:conserved exported hypothetical protein [Vibrio chagasii]